MANKKITQLIDLPIPAGADILAIVDDVAGTPTTKKVTATNLMTLAPVQSVAGQTGTVTLSNTDISGLGSLATANNVEGEGGVVSTGETGGVKFLREDGDGTCSWQLAEADVDGPLTIALRGTDNPHIGANPDQSFKVMDNPAQSAMVIADSDGNITYLLKSTTAEVKVAKGNGSAVRFALASDLPAFVLENDSGEPDIEVTDSATGEKISVISGDSDTKGANGIPIRQGYNLPDMGAYPSPLLISGGSIA